MPNKSKSIGFDHFQSFLEPLINLWNDNSIKIAGESFAAVRLIIQRVSQEEIITYISSLMSSFDDIDNSRKHFFFDLIAYLINGIKDNELLIEILLPFIELMQNSTNEEMICAFCSSVENSVSFMMFSATD